VPSKTYPAPRPSLDPAPPNQGARQKPKPTMGRDVVFNHDPETFNHHTGVNGKVSKTQSPAKILHVHSDGTVRLMWFHPHGVVKLVQSAAEADPKVTPPVPGTWQWPTLV
jgi:hypothetical protein